MSTRFTGGLAAAALLAGGLACQGGAASAADVTGYPATLDFAPHKLVATDGGVFAAGVSDDWTAAYVDEVGGGEVTLDTGADQVYGVDLAAEPDGGSLLAVVSTDTGYQEFTVDTGTLAVAALPAPATYANVDALGTDAGGVFQVSRNDAQELGLTVPDLGYVTLDDSGSAIAAAATGAVGHRDWYVGGTHYTGPTGGVATLWSYDEATGAAATPLVLGPDGDPDGGVLDVVADAATGTVYAVSFQDQESGPQTYGLSVVRDGAATYYPLTSVASELALSADGGTLYVGEMGSLLALDTGRLAPDMDAADDLRATWLESGSIDDLTTDPAGRLFAAAGNDVHAFTDPGAVDGLAFEGESDYPSYGVVRWNAPATTGGTSADNLYYDVTVTDRSGGDPRTTRTFMTEQDFDDLVPGHTYDVSVAVDNGLFRGPSATSSFTAATATLAHPSSVAVRGPAAVGSRLSVANRGAWASGTALTYRWTAGGAQVSTARTLTVTPAMLGKRIAVSVTGTLGESTATVSSTPTAAVSRGTLSGATPRILGTAKVGKRLKAVAGRWTAGTRLAYSWAANGKRIAGTGPSLKVRKALAGKRVTVTVTGTRAGYRALARTSAATAAVKR